MAAHATSIQTAHRMPGNNRQIDTFLFYDNLLLKAFCKYVACNVCHKTLAPLLIVQGLPVFKTIYFKTTNVYSLVTLLHYF